jgi:hypothetical protein
MKDCRKTMSYQEIEASAESLYVHPCPLKSEFNIMYQGLALINGILISDDEILRMHGRRDDDEDSLSFVACRSRRLANLSGVQLKGEEVIPSWEDHLMDEEACHDASEDFAPFDKDTIAVCVLTENSSYYIADLKNYFDRHYKCLGNYWDYTNENLTADQVASAKKINMGKNQVNAIMTYISFNRLCLTNLMCANDLAPDMKDYWVQLLTMSTDVLLRHCRKLLNYIKVLENKLLREWDDEGSPGIHADPPYLFEPKNSPPLLIDAPEKDYQIFDAEDPKRLFSRMAVKLWNGVEHDGLFGKRRNGVPGEKQKPPSHVDLMGKIPRKDLGPPPAVVEGTPAESQKKRVNKGKDSSLYGADAKPAAYDAKPAAHDSTKKIKKTPSKSQQTGEGAGGDTSTKKRKSDDGGAAGDNKKKRRIKNATGAKKPDATTVMRTPEEFYECFASLLLARGINRSGMTNITKNAASLSLMMHKDAVEKLRKEQRHAYSYLTGIDSQMEMLRNHSIPDDVKASSKTHLEDVFKQISNSFDVQKRALEKKDSQKVVPGKHNCS